MGRVVSAVALTLTLAACNLSVVAEDQDLYRQTLGKADAPAAAPAEGEEAPATPFFLARPLSGPRYRHANVFGSGPVLSAGTRVWVDRVERGGVTGTIPPQWYDWYPETIAHIRRVYRIYFHTDAGPCDDGCWAHWRAADDGEFEERFAEVFVGADPLAALDADTRALVEAHKVASWFDAETVRLSVGEPNAIVTAGTTSRWVFEERYCQGLYLIAAPELALDFRGEDVQAFERLSATDFYYPLEPLDPHAGLCTVVELPGGPYLAGGTGTGGSSLEAQLCRWGGGPEVHRIGDRAYWASQHWNKAK